MMCKSTSLDQATSCEMGSNEVLMILATTALSSVVCKKKDTSSFVSPRKVLRFQSMDQQTSNPNTCDSSSSSSSSSVSQSPAPSPPLFPHLTENVIRELWYHKEEIAEARKQVGKLIRRRLNRANSNKQGGNISNCSETEEMAGLERHDLERHCAKKAAVKLVLLAQTFHFADADYLRSVSEKCSEQARAIAVVQGYRDFCQVYSAKDAVRDCASEKSLNLKRSAPSNDNEFTARRVRCRQISF